MADLVSKEEYLKRYLGENSAKKKTKKVKKIAKQKLLPRSKIVDDDIDIKVLAPNDSDDCDFDYGDDAPQVAGIVDERPADVRKMEEFDRTKMWKVLGASDDEDNIADHVEGQVQQEVKGRWSSKVVRKKSPSPEQLRQGRLRRRHHSVDSDKVQSRHDSGSDESPPRKTRVIKTERKDASPDQSPPRKANRPSSDTDLSPPRKRKMKEEPPDSDLSPPRRSTTSEPEPMRKTLDGKRAGLQDAATLRRENEGARERERRLFEKAGDEVLGKHAQTVVRDRSTGKRRDFKAEEQRKQEAAALKEAREAKYKQWNKGLKQVDMHKERLQSDLHEMSKPLTRYESDEDLDKMLRSQEREGDPMLAFIKKKNRKVAGLDPNKVVPRYSGPPAPPNRYGIDPGYRWDGVDRSNGFEKSRFTRQNDRKANLEQAYKWSVEDM